MKAYGFYVVIVLCATGCSGDPTPSAKSRQGTKVAHSGGPLLNVVFDWKFNPGTFQRISGNGKDRVTETLTLKQNHRAELVRKSAHGEPKTIKGSWEQTIDGCGISLKEGKGEAREVYYKGKENTLTEKFAPKNPKVYTRS